ncbi:MAG: (2Fe-2S) ferredoxin domain-containing protein [Candidatus Cloacimonetes bacterium]|nr:(2Fe-2S) ferredoxin domain-containing protein [Candidatus Cloacimonadota bacterium]
MGKIKNIREKLVSEQSPVKYKVFVSMGTSAICTGANLVYQAFLDGIKERKLDDIIIRKTGENGMASLEPIVKIFENGKHTATYFEMTSQKVKKIIDEHIINGKIITRF